MNALPGSIFICYRRRDSADSAGRLREKLAAIFGDNAIFMDVHDIPIGVDFREHIRSTLAKCRAGLVLIGPDWLTLRDQETGERRIDAPEDHVRIEIETMLAKPNLLLLPCLVRHAVMPEAEDFPESIRTLAFRNSAQVRPDPDFLNDVARLTEQLRARLARPPKKPLLARIGRLVILRLAGRPVRSPSATRQTPVKSPSAASTQEPAVKGAPRPTPSVAPESEWKESLVGLVILIAFAWGAWGGIINPLRKKTQELWPSWKVRIGLATPTPMPTLIDWDEWRLKSGLFTPRPTPFSTIFSTTPRPGSLSAEIIRQARKTPPPSPAPFTPGSFSERYKRLFASPTPAPQKPYRFIFPANPTPASKK